jgi:hypothetical protein
MSASQVAEIVKVNQLKGINHFIPNTHSNTHTHTHTHTFPRTDLEEIVVQKASYRETGRIILLI